MASRVHACAPAPVAADVARGGESRCTELMCRTMFSQALEAVEEESVSWRALGSLRLFALLSYQVFPAIYFAAFDGVLPPSVTEPLWTLCDWCLKMALTSSLMEANFYTTAQRRERAHRIQKDLERMKNISNLTAAVEAKGECHVILDHYF
jgi:hypothetical protein